MGTRASRDFFHRGTVFSFLLQSEADPHFKFHFFFLQQKLHGNLFCISQHNKKLMCMKTTLISASSAFQSTLNLTAVCCPTKAESSNWRSSEVEKNGFKAVLINIFIDKSEHEYLNVTGVDNYHPTLHFLIFYNSSSLFWSLSSVTLA